MKKLYRILELYKYYYSFINFDLLKIYSKKSNVERMDNRSHIDAAVQWLCRAQDSFVDDGVARCYFIVYDLFFKRKGWMPSYPETTGYIIPIMFDYVNLTSNDEIYNRALRMADWECDIQMENGAVQGGTVDENPTPAIFNTGQVIFGWVRAFLETKSERYLESAVKAGEFLISQQDNDGAWRKNLSNYATKNIETYTYNTRTAWALIDLYKATDDLRYKEAAIKNVEFSLTQQLPNGWFKNNCLSNASQPLLHTIAYCVRGILEVGYFLENHEYIAAAKKAADSLINQQRNDGSLSGRFDNSWKPTVKWSCLTGDAQTAVIWGRLFQITGEPKYLDSLMRMNAYLKSVQLLQTRNPDIYGGIGGSYPIHGAYGKFQVLNWAVKFFVDALMIELSIQNNDRRVV